MLQSYLIFQSGVFISNFEHILHFLKCFTDY